VAVPKITAGYGQLPRQIPSMQGVLIRALNSSSDATFKTNYNSVVMRNDSVLRAPGINAVTPQELVLIRIDVKSMHYSDRMWIFSDPACTRGFDNDWDGEKISGPLRSSQLFAMEEDGNYQVNAVPDIHYMVLGFQAGEAVENFPGIANAPKIRPHPNYDDPEIMVPDYNSLPKVYIVNSQAGTSKPISPANYSVFLSSKNRGVLSPGSNGAGGGLSCAGSGSMLTHQNNTSQPVGISTFNTDLAQDQDPSTRQLTPPGVLEGGTDPGEDPETGPIPVGDGLWILILLTASYVFKILIASKCKLHQNTNYTKIRITRIKNSKYTN